MIIIIVSMIRIITIIMISMIRIITIIMIIMIRIRLIVSSTDISEEAELRLTSMLNETIKNYWVALGQMTMMAMVIIVVLLV